MRFVHTTVHEILGTIGPEEGETVLLDESGSGSFACLTKDPHVHCLDADQSAAISMMLLRGLVGGGPKGSFKERLEVEIKAARDKREPRKKGRTYLVFRREGEVPDWEPRAEQEVDDIVLRLNGAPGDQIREESRALFSSLVLALTLVIENPLRITRYSDAIVFYRTDGKKVFAKKFSATGSAMVATSFPDTATKRIEKAFHNVVALKDLSRVLKLFSGSLEAADDPLRSFLSGWAALEIFVHKVFAQYEAEFFNALGSGHLPQAHSAYLARVRNVMQSKYRLVDRFALIASRLAPEHADADLKRFTEAKRSRDALAHGQDEDEVNLPVGAVQGLLKRYVQRHAGIAGSW